MGKRNVKAVLGMVAVMSMYHSYMQSAQPLEEAVEKAKLQCAWMYVLSEQALREATPWQQRLEASKHVEPEALMPVAAQMFRALSGFDSAFHDATNAISALKEERKRKEAANAKRKHKKQQYRAKLKQRQAGRKN